MEFVMMRNTGKSSRPCKANTETRRRVMLGARASRPHSLRSKLEIPVRATRSVRTGRPRSQRYKANCAL